MGARNRDAAVAASSFVVAHIVAAGTAAPLLVVRAAKKRRYRNCCPLLWRCCCHRGDVRCRCDDALGLPWCRSTRSCVQLRKAVGLSDLRRIAHVAVIATIKPGKRQAKNPRTASPLTSLISSPQRLARRGAHASAHASPFCLQGLKFFYAVGCQIRRQAGTAPRIA